MNGKLVGGSGTGPQPTWSASGNAVAPFFVTPHTKIKTLGSPKETFSGNQNSSPVSSNWTCSPTWTGYSALTGKSSITVGPSGDWNPAMSGEYSITAKKAADTSKTDLAILKIVEPQKIEAVVDSAVTSISTYGTTAADNNPCYVGDTPISRRTINIPITATITPSIPHADIPSGWVGMTADSDMSSLFTADSTEPKLKGKIIPNISGKIGYVYVGVPVGNKYIKIIKFCNIVMPTPPSATDLWVLKTASKASLKYADFYANVLPATIESATNYEWEIVSGSDKVELIYNHVENNTNHKYCRIQAKGVDHLSASAGDITVKVKWEMRGEKAEVAFALTVRSLHTLDVVSNGKVSGYQYRWQVQYQLRDQLGTALPDNICSGLGASESWSKDLWSGYSPTLGSPTLTVNSLTDTFGFLLDVRPPGDGNGTQTITLDHIKRTHDVKIELIGSTVVFENITYTYNN
jgi:hypothetical protein